MAILKSNTTFNIYEELEAITEVVPVQANQRILKKKTWSNEANDFVEHLFIGIPLAKANLEWLKKNYPRHGYLTNWWNTNSEVMMEEKVFTHYRLCE